MSVAEPAPAPLSSPPLAPPPQPLTFAVVGAGAVAFLCLGVLQAIYGPAFPAFEERFGVVTARVGLIASAHFIGSAAAPPLAGLLLARLGVGRVVGGAFTLLAAGALLVAAAPTWPLTLLGALLGGLGLGGVSGALNAAYAGVGTRAINFVNALFGVGSMLAPLLLALTARQVGSPADGLPLAFVTIAVLAGLSLLAARLWGLPRLLQDTGTESSQARRSTLALFAGLLLLYVGVEVGSGAWAANYLGAVGHASPALVVSAYWGGLTVSRVLTSLFASHVAPGRLVLGAALLAAVGSALTALPALAPFAYVLVGVACGPIFPTTLAWAARRIPARLVASLLVSGSVGGVLMPWLLGLGFTGAGSWAVPALLTGAAALLAVLVALTLRRVGPGLEG
ncbi:MFS transporter [Deinococcus sp. PESE-13]